jgi:hypothetical protein
MKWGMAGRARPTQEPEQKGRREARQEIDRGSSEPPLSATLARWFAFGSPSPSAHHDRIKWRAGTALPL